MKRTAVLISACLATAVTVAALAVPAAAANKGRVAIVNGRPGPTTELCINGKEVKSSYRYGATWVRQLDPGQKVMKLRKKSYGTCRGKVFAKKALPLAAGDDWVVVFTRLDPKVVTFDKSTKPDYDNGIVLRNASDLGTLGFRYERYDEGTSWFDLATVGTSEFEKGDGEVGGALNVIFWAHQVPNTGVVGTPFTAGPPTGMYHDAIVVGTDTGNARWVHLVLTRL